MTRKSDFTRALASLALAGAAAVTTLQAANGDIPIYQPTTITQPGHYVVTRDIASTGGSVITFGTSQTQNVSNVTLDLNGHTLSTDNTNPLIVVDGVLFKRGLTIRNGRLQGNGAGTGHAIHGFGANLEVRIQDLEIANFDGDGIHFDSVGYLEVVRCRIHDVDFGLNVSFSGSVPFTGAVIENSLERIQRHGMVFGDLQNGHIKGNVIKQFGLLGVPASGVGLFGSAVGAAVGGNVIEGNIVSQHPGANPTIGIYLGDVSRNRITENVVNKNGSTGISVGGTMNHLEGNQTQGNFGCGIQLNGNANTYRNNVGGGNTSFGATCMVAGNVDLGGNTGL